MGLKDSSKLWSMTTCNGTKMIPGVVITPPPPPPPPPSLAAAAAFSLVAARVEGLAWGE